MDLSTKIYSSVLKVKNKIGNLVESATLRIDSSQTYNVFNGQKVTTFTNKTINIVLDKFKYHEIDNIQVKSSDIKIIMFNEDDTIPTLNHKVIYHNNTYSVINVQPINVGAKIAIYILQVRL